MTGCESSYSPNTYSSNAVQLANVVNAGIVVGSREVQIRTNGNVGAVTGGAAGGILAAQYTGSALAAVGATAVGLLAGSAIDHATGDTTGWEYIVRKPNGDMGSVTQREEKPLALGQKVLVIMGPQARVVPDYSMAAEPPTPEISSAKAESKPEAPVKVELVLSLAPGVAAQMPSAQTVAAQPATPAVSAEAMPTVVAVPEQPSSNTPPEGYKLISMTPDSMPPSAKLDTSSDEVPANDGSHQNTRQ